MEEITSFYRPASEEKEKTSFGEVAWIVVVIALGLAFLLLAGHAALHQAGIV